MQARGRRAPAGCDLLLILALEYTQCNLLGPTNQRLGAFHMDALPRRSLKLSDTAPDAGINAAQQCLYIYRDCWLWRGRRCPPVATAAATVAGAGAAAIARHENGARSSSRAWLSDC